VETDKVQRHQERMREKLQWLEEASVNIQGKGFNPYRDVVTALLGNMEVSPGAEADNSIAQRVVCEIVEDAEPEPSYSDRCDLCDSPWVNRVCRGGYCVRHTASIMIGVRGVDRALIPYDVSGGVVPMLAIQHTRCPHCGVTVARNEDEGGLLIEANTCNSCNREVL
jgi:hypothetical protein